ncbi:MAG: hypothetical protein E7446_05310 [Ruminococcaceae bacterium]|nr:hypothetical protein [Oscillospiraceae bacterium]
MKQTGPIFKILATVILAGVLLFFGVQMYQYYSDPFTTTLVYAAETDDAISVDGWMVRQEETIHAAGTLVHELLEGEKVGAGQVIATAYSSSGALETVREMEAKELQLQQLEFALASYLDPDAALKLDSSIFENLLTLRGDLADGDYANASEHLSQLKGNILKRSHSYSSAPEIQAQIGQVQSELDALRAQLSGANVIYAQRPALFSAVCDGYETMLTPGMLADLMPSQLEKLKAQALKDEVGKLVYGDTWYYAAVMTQEDVARLEDREQVALRLGKGMEIDITMQILAPGEVENGKQVVVLRSDKYLPQVTQLRHLTAELLLNSYSGLRIPANALRLDENGQSGVYCVVGFTAAFKPVDVVYRGDGYTLVRAADGATGSDILRAGDEVIVTAGELYDGKVVR